MNLRYTATALRELDQGIAYFLENAPAYAGAFTDYVNAVVARILTYPKSAQETDMPGIRRAYVRRFHYSIFYTIDRDEIVILNIRHASRRFPWEDDTE